MLMICVNVVQRAERDKAPLLWFIMLVHRSITQQYTSLYKRPLTRMNEEIYTRIKTPEHLKLDSVESNVSQLLTFYTRGLFQDLTAEENY